MIYQLNELDGLSKYVTSFLTLELRGFIDVTEIKLAKAVYLKEYIHNRYSLEISPERFNNKLLSITSKCTLKSTGETKYVVPVFTAKTYCPNFYFEQEGADFYNKLKSLPKHQQKEYADTHGEDLNKSCPYGIFYHGTDDIHYGFRLNSIQEVEDYLQLEEAVGELDTIMWRN